MLIIVGHSEYWSTAACNAVDSFLRRGGNLVVLSGNTMFWRVGYDETRSVMECRKWEYDSAQRGNTLWNLQWDRPLGELYHSADKERGGLMRQCGMPAFRLIGLESIGWWPHFEADHFGRYQVTVPENFLFQQPVPVGKGEGESIGHGENGGLPRAVGHEADVSFAVLNAMTKSIPEEVQKPLSAEAKGLRVLARSYYSGDIWTILDDYANKAEFSDGIAFEVVYWERPEGGKVFNVGSVGAGWPLLEDPGWSSLLNNVLPHFGAR